MKLHFLGTTGYHPNNTRQTACLMLPELGIIFDAGTGIFRARDLIQTETLDIFLSHVHLDHSVGLTFLYDVLYDKDISRVTVHIAKDKIDAVENHLFSQQLFPIRPNFEIRPFDNDPIQLANGLAIETIPLIHPGGCHGFRVDWPGCSFAYITDTTARLDADYISRIEGVETLIHECYFPDGLEDRAELTGHSCLTPVAQVAQKANVKKMYLVHINPLTESNDPLDLASVHTIFENVSVAHDGLVIDV